MKNITLLIPTRDRVEKLLKTLGSVPTMPNLNIVVVFDGDEAGYAETVMEGIELRRSDVELILHLEHRGSVSIRNTYIPEVCDGLLYGTDDIIFEAGAIGHAFDLFNDIFPDDDGVIGFHQIGTQDYHPAGVGLVGQKFLQRYPGKRLFFPGYYHFSCQEILWLCEDIGEKFILDPHAVVKHLHPCFHADEMDTTHVEARRHKKHDMDLIRERSSKGLIWGKPSC
jgi:glycosyltransferase involved in cell wall biosynthesis